jgi:GTP-binding protein HflX
MTKPDLTSAEPSAGELDLDDRAALRRVAGLSTELADVSEVEYRQLRLERVVLVGVWTEGSAADADASLAELAALAETAGSEVLEGIIQRRDKPDPATYIGSGKALELRQIVVATGADTVICDGELRPAQLNALEKVVKVKVIDRTALILDIFAQHASSREGKAQVELAQMQYMLPRLRGWGESMSRQAGGRAGGSGGGVGTRGPGETKIETDRRRIRDRDARLQRLPERREHLEVAARSGLQRKWLDKQGAVEAVRLDAILLECGLDPLIDFSRRAIAAVPVDGGRPGLRNQIRDDCLGRTLAQNKLPALCGDPLAEAAERLVEPPPARPAGRA